jgi:hypothetical protein
MTTTHIDRNGDDVRTWSGFKYSTISRVTRTLCVVVDNRDETWETGNADKWLTICDEHATVCSHSTHRLARDHAADPSQWCEPCADAVQHGTIEPSTFTSISATIDGRPVTLSEAFDAVVAAASRLDDRTNDEIADDHDRRYAGIPCSIDERHCESCGSTDYEDLNCGDQGYTACCNELTTDRAGCRAHHVH